jgi:hypothetical protein
MAKNAQAAPSGYHTDQFRGDRTGGLEDPFGHRWWLAQRIVAADWLVLPGAATARMIVDFGRTGEQNLRAPISRQHVDQSRNGHAG